MFGLFSKKNVLAPENIAPVNDGKFFMEVSDVFQIPGRGFVVAGKIKQGVVYENNEVLVRGTQGVEKMVVFGIEIFKEPQKKAQAGEFVGIILRSEKSMDLRSFGIKTIEALPLDIL